MASSPVAAPSPKIEPPPPPSSSSPPPAKDSPPPPQSQPPPDEATPPPPSTSPPPSPPLSPPPAAASPPPTTASPSPPSTTLPPPQPTTPPATTTPTPPIPINNTPPQSPQTGAPPAPENAAPSPPISAGSNVIPPPSPFSKSSPSSGELSPPRAPTHRAPATPSSHDNSAPSQEVNKLPLIVGITAGVGILFVALVVIFVLCNKKKKRKPVEQMQYYGNPPHGSKAAGYYDNRMQQQQPMWYNNNNQQMKPGSLKVPPPPGLMGQAGGGWPQPHQLSPSNPNHNSSSSDMSSDPHYSVMVPQSPNGTLGMNKSTFSYDELAIATNGFSQANLLGQGGFGYVHKGVLPNGKVVAVKCLKAGSGQGEREFQAEVEIISRVHHRHLVSLVGYCMAGDQRILVYEFVPNKTLEFHLHGKDCPHMEWHKRLTIALGAAKGLAYLHEDCHPRIIHRDIKAANILIDNNFEAMVADFGLAKLSQDNITHVSTRVMGTFGYLAPEYASSGKLTEKSDVFSFGVMLLELITGRRPVDTTNSYMDDSLVDWARPIMARCLSNHEFDELVDKRLENLYNEHEMERMIACAAASIRHSSRRRPKMSQIVRALEGDVSLEALNEGVQPGQSTAFSSSGADYDKSSYNADLKKFRKMALASQEVGSDLSGAATSTYGLNPSDSSTDDCSTSGEIGKAGSIKR